MLIRNAKTEDIEKIREINSQAFETEVEASLVDNLRKRGTPLISLVAEVKGEIVGHILFSPVKLMGNKSDIKIDGLAPMAVKPDSQKQGIGTALIKRGLMHCKSEGYQTVVVLGHPDYYPRFGFVPSSKYGIKSEYDVPYEVFMIKELENGALTDCTGIVKYHEAFNKL